MRTHSGCSRAAISFLTFALSLSGVRHPALAQGWEFVGPDSLTWRSVERLSAMWTANGQMLLAAVTGQGVAIFQEDSSWTYPLRNVEGSIYFPGHWYSDFAFLPAQPESVLAEIDVECTELCPEIWKLSYPAMQGRWELPPPGGWNCWFGRGQFLISEGGSPAVYLGLCRLYRSDDCGTNWTLVAGDPEQMDPLLELLSVDRASDATLLASRDGALGRFREGGGAEDTVMVLRGQGRITDAISFGDTLIAAFASWIDSSEERGIHRSTDGGKSWAHVFTGSDVYALEWTRPPDEIIFAGGAEGMFRSSDYGATWQAFNRGLPSRFFTDMQATSSPDTVLAATRDQGILKVWQYAAEVKQEPEGPFSLTLWQNFPNPFNAETRISWYLPSTLDVRLSVYDLLGREVGLAAEGQMGRGPHIVRFEGKSLSSGVYVCRLQAGGVTLSRRMLLLR